MYQEFFGLNEKPFSITPNPRFLYLSDQHKEALAHLVYGTDESGSFALLTGDVGTGKTTLCRTLVEQAPEDVNLALILNPLLTPVELLATICDEFNIDYYQHSESRKPLLDALNEYLLEVYSRGERAVLIIDEAQNLDAPTLEQIRLLTNLETGEHKLLKIILIGQPELRELLEDESLTQLAQRITARYHLPPLNREETDLYIEHRLNVAGADRQIFNNKAKDELFKHSKGVPRVINVISERALLGAYAKGTRTVNRGLVRDAIAEVLGRGGKVKLDMPTYLVLGSIALASLSFLLAGWNMYQQDNPVSEAPLAMIQPETSTTVASNSATVSTPVIQAATTSSITTEVDDTAAAEDFAAFSIATDLQSLLDEYGETEVAFDTLFQLWGLPASQLEGDTACMRAESNGLACIYETGGLENLISYNRPAVLELVDDFGKKRMAVASSIDENSITLDMSGNLHTVSLSELQDRWRGNFVLLWRLPPEGSKLLESGMQSSDVAWLASRLDIIDGLEPLEYGDTYSENLEQRVMQYQSDRGIPSDGIADPRTLIKLAVEVDSSQTPTLFR